MNIRTELWIIAGCLLLSLLFADAHGALVYAALSGFCGIGAGVIGGIESFKKWGDSNLMADPEGTKK